MIARYTAGPFFVTNPICGKASVTKACNSCLNWYLMVPA
jgi:hypothetical protein